MSTRAQLALRCAFALSGVVLGCRGREPAPPMTGELELCCKAANEDDISFVGCRPAGLCRANESVWVRGPLTCTAEAFDECAGGHCCSLDLDDVESADSELPTAEAEPEPEPAPSPAPEPAPIVPIDWRPR